MKKLFKKKKKGFTLVELLVVIAVLGIMAGIGLNSMSGITDIFRKRADDKTLDQVARTMQIRLMADDHKLLPASPSSELVYTTDIVPEMNLISQTTGELMIAKATGYKIFGNQNIAQDELNTNDLELYVTFYSDSADGKKHYRRSATISATYIHWDDENGGSGSGSGSGNGGSGSNTYTSFNGSNNFDGYLCGAHPGMYHEPVEETLEHNGPVEGVFVFADKDLEGFVRDNRIEIGDNFNANNMVTSNLQTKNFYDAFLKENPDADFSKYESLAHIDPKYDSPVLVIDDITPEMFGSLDIDSKNTLISPVTGASYKMEFCEFRYPEEGDFGENIAGESPSTIRRVRFVSEGNGLRTYNEYSYMLDGAGNNQYYDGASNGDTLFHWYVSKTN